MKKIAKQNLKTIKLLFFIKDNTFFFNDSPIKLLRCIISSIQCICIVSFFLLFSAKSHSQCIVTTTNADFEYPVRRGIANFVNQNSLPSALLGWRTTATDGMLEFWGWGSGIIPPSGNQFVELNANEPSGLYQDFDTSVATYFEYSFWHRGRNGTDKMELLAGPPQGPFVSVKEAETDNFRWVNYTGNYQVPPGQAQTRFIFIAVSTAGNDLSTGNFLDNIHFTATIDPPTIAPQDFDLGSDSQKTICSGTSHTFRATGHPNAVYYWYDSTGTALLYIGNSFNTGNLTQNTAYKVKQVNAAGCESPFLDIMVVINPLPTADLSAVQNSICPGSETQILFTGTPNTEITYTVNGAPKALQLDRNGFFLLLTGNLTADTRYIIEKAKNLSTNCEDTITGKEALISIQPLQTVTPPSGSPAVCLTMPITEITHTVTGAAGIGAPVGLPAGVAASWINNTIKISGTPQVSGVFNYSIPLAGGCGNISAAGNITVNSQPEISPIASPAAICAGSTLALTAPAITENGSPIISQGWHLDNMPFDPASALIRSDDGKTLVYKARNSCGETISNIVKVTVYDKPAISPIAPPAAICEGNALALTAPAVNSNGTPIISQGWYLDDILFDPSSTLTLADDGKTLVYKARNTCGETMSNIAAIAVHDKPEISPIAAPAAICAGSTLTLTAPAVDPNGSSIISQGWYLDDILFDPASVLTLTDNGKTLVYKARNSCGETISNIVRVTVYDKPEISPIAAPAAICEGNALALAAPAAAPNGSPIISQGWYLDDILFDPASVLTLPDNGKTLVYKARNSCGETVSNIVRITVHDKPAISPIAPPPAICEGNALALAAPAVNPNGAPIISQGWYLDDLLFDPASALTLADNGKTLVYKARNTCGETMSNIAAIAVHDKPEISPITAPAAICAGSTLALAAPAVNPNGAPIISQGWHLDNMPFDPASALTRADNGKTLVYKARNTCGETVSNIVRVTVYDKPEISPIAAPAAICAGNALALAAPAVNPNGAPIISQGWYLDDILFDPASVLTLADNGKTLVYKVRNSCGETISNIAAIAVHDKPEISPIAAPAAICAGSVLALAAPAVDPNGSSIISQGWNLDNMPFNPASVLTHADNGKTLVYKARNSCGETISNLVRITVHDKPAISPIAAPAAICAGNALALAAPAAAPNGSPIISQGWHLDNMPFDPASALTRADNGKTLVYKARNTCGETISNIVRITVYDKPAISPIAPPAAICEGNALALAAPVVAENGSPIISQGWHLDNMPFDPASVLTLADNGKTLIYKARNSCGETISNLVRITVHDKPAISPIAAPAAICAGNALALAAPAVTPNGSPIISQGWYLDNIIFDPLTPLKHADNGKTLTYKVISSCGEARSNTVIVSVIPPLKSFLISDSVLPEICEGDRNGTFSIQIIGGIAPYSVALNDENGSYQQITGSEHSFDKLSGGRHIAYIKDDLNCTAHITVMLPDAVKMDPAVKIDYSCQGNTPENSVSVAISSAAANPDDVDYSLDGGAYQSESTFKNLLPGQHIIAARHLNGCIQNTAAFTIDEINPLQLSITSPEMNVIAASASQGSGSYQYSFQDEPYSSNAKFTIYKSGIYAITAKDSNGCSITVSQYFEYIDVCIPNYFTPNADGINDQWGPDCTSIYKNLTYIILDRYGRKLAFYRYGQKWDGKYKGQELPSGDYWYVLKLNDPKDSREFVGHFTLYR